MISHVHRAAPSAAMLAVTGMLFALLAGIPPLMAAGRAPGGRPSPSAVMMAQTDAGRMIEGIRIETGVANKVGVFFKLNGAFTPECFTLVGPDRKLVCDFIDTSIARDIDRSVKIESDLVFKLRIGWHIEPKRKIRVVLDMDQAKSYDVEQLFVKGKNEYVLVIKPLTGRGGP